MIVAGPNMYGILADTLLVLHFLIVTFVVGGFLLIWIGRLAAWQWIRDYWFRIVHIATVGFVTLQAVGGNLCPFTLWENHLRELAGSEGRYTGSFIQYWLHKILYYDIRLEIFAVIYMLFLLLCIAAWFLVKPRIPKKKQ